jgi:hypothetical protein
MYPPNRSTTGLTASRRSSGLCNWTAHASGVSATCKRERHGRPPFLRRPGIVAGVRCEEDVARVYGGWPLVSRGRCLPRSSLLREGVLSGCREGVRVSTPPPAWALGRADPCHIGSGIAGGATRPGGDDGGAPPGDISTVGLGASMVQEASTGEGKIGTREEVPSAPRCWGLFI